MSASKVVATGAAAFVVVLAVVAVIALITAYPLMLVLGALHGSHGLSAVPALGFFQTLGSLFVIASVGSAWRGSEVKVK